MYPCQSRIEGMEKAIVLKYIYKKLFDYFGPQYWWPAETPFEVIIGAILTQAVSWSNVEKALDNLKKRDLLSHGKLTDLSEKELAQYIKPAGYYNMKARKIKAFLSFLEEEYAGSLEKMFKESLKPLRKQLLNVYGIGPETADSILLYAGEYPIFVVDNYTRRIFSRLGLVDEDIKYPKLQDIFMDNLPAVTKLYNEYHALLVALGNEICHKKKPDCGACPLKK